MNYELAKQLKDAGFPQDEENLRCRCSFSEEKSKPETEVYFGHREGVYLPTLSELIEATALDSIVCLIGRRHWRASKLDEKEHLIETLGPTPEEAVAKLWLALNTV